MAPKVYIVQSGDCLSKIAKANGISTAELAALNGIKNPDKINPGQELIINPQTDGQEAGLDTVDLGNTSATAEPTAPASTAPVQQAAAAQQTNNSQTANNVYEVKRGDTLSKIAKKYGVSQRELQLYNGIEDANKIEVGQKITIPPKYTTAQIQDKIRTKAQAYGIDESLALAVAELESGFDPYAGSKKGAKGIFQLMDKTAESLGVNNSYDVEQNIDGGLKYLRQLLDKENNDVKRALIAYNAGPVKLHNALANPENKDKTIDDIDSLITNKKNGKGYTANVLELQKKYEIA